MLIITRDSITATRDKLGDPGKKNEVIDDINKMIEIKSALEWRSDAMSPCCGTLSGYTCQLTNEIDVLGDILKAVEDGDKSKASDLLDTYAGIVEENQSRESKEPRFS